MKLRPGATLPDELRREVTPPGMYWQKWRGIWVLRRKPYRRSGPITSLQQDVRTEFKAMAAALKDIAPWDQITAETISWNSLLTWRDVMATAMIGRLIVIAGVLPEMAYPDLDMIGKTPGGLLFRDPGAWLLLPPGTQGQVLTMDGGFPNWRVLPDPGGGGGGDLPPSGVTAGTYNHVKITVTETGIITDASENVRFEGAGVGDFNGAPAEAVFSVDDDSQWNAWFANKAADATEQLGLAVGFTSAGKGYIWATTSGGARVLYFSDPASGYSEIELPDETGALITTGGLGTVSAPMLADTAVTPGTYALAEITVDQQGRITSAASGPGGGGGSGATPKTLAGSPTTLTIAGTSWSGLEVTDWSNPGDGTAFKYSLAYHITSATNPSAAIVLINNSGNGYYLNAQGDGTLVIYRFTAAAQTAIGATNSGGSGGVSAQIGKHSIQLAVERHNGALNHFAATAGGMSGFIFDKTSNQNDFNSGTWKLYAAYLSGAAIDALWETDTHAAPYAAT